MMILTFSIPVALASYRFFLPITVNVSAGGIFSIVYTDPLAMSIVVLVGAILTFSTTLIELLLDIGTISHIWHSRNLISKTMHIQQQRRHEIGLSSKKILMD
uniref:Uncharacterized protein n=1 Tax=Acrobeloides nanus TaxID=290746 RepID=A0A914BVA7_9BILA